MLKQLKGLLRLTRYRDFLAFATIDTLLGAIAAEAPLSWKLILVLLANLLAVCFAFMINDVEDAEDDALNPHKVNRNPVSSKDITARSGYLASFGVAAFSAIAYAFLGWVPFIIGIISLLTGFFYSWRPVRFKNMFLFDMVSHCLMLAGFQYLPAFYAFQSQMTVKGFVPFVFLICFSLYGELFNELRDLEHDLQAGLRHTAATLGYQATYRLMIIIALLGVVCGVISLFFIKLLPFWLLAILGALVILFFIPPMLKIREKKTPLELQHAFQEPIEHAAVIGFILYFIIRAIWKV